MGRNGILFGGSDFSKRFTEPGKPQLIRITGRKKLEC
jgi:hypothetical protein